MSGQWRITVDPEQCISCGNCEGLAPKYFRVAEHSYPVAEVVDPDPDVLMAAWMCPAEAITVTNAETGELIEG